jgi:hypothetical protein
LLTGTGGLDHLVAGAIAFVQKAVTEMDGSVVDNFRLLIRKQIGVAAVGRDEAIRHGPLLSKGECDQGKLAGQSGALKKDSGATQAPAVDSSSRPFCPFGHFFSSFLSSCPVAFTVLLWPEFHAHVQQVAVRGPFRQLSQNQFDGHSRPAPA